MLKKTGIEAICLSLDLWEIHATDVDVEKSYLYVYV